MSQNYSGVDNLNVMSIAQNYTNFLLGRILFYAEGVTELLDFGAGIGTCAVPLRETGARVTCVEPDLELQRHLKDFDFEVYPDISGIPPETYGLIYSLNVLEHIEDDISTLRALIVLLKPGGRLLLYVPAFQGIYSSMDEKVGHFRRYTAAGLIAKLIEVGFVVERARYVDSLGVVFTILYKIFGSKRGDINITQVKIYDAFFFPVSILLDRALGFFVGKNLEVVARRP